MPLLQTYKPSGRFEPSTIPYALGLGLVGALGVGWLYQWLVDIVPFIYVNALATMGLGAIIGYLVGMGAKTGKCRNLMIAALIAIVCACAAEGATLYYAYQRAYTKYEARATEYIQQAVKSGRVPADKATDMLLAVKQKYTFGHYIELRVKYGWKLRRTITLNGAMVYVIWSIELLILLGFSVFISRSMVQAPFCERRNRWAEEVNLGVVNGIETEFVYDAYKNGDLEAFVDVENMPVSEMIPSILTYTLYPCEGNSYLTAQLVISAINEKGETKDSTDTIFEYVMLDADQTERLKHAFGQ